MRVRTAGYGVQLSLAMPHGPYAWNSFLPVTTRLLNVSDRGVRVGFTEESFSCFFAGPVVEVRQRVAPDSPCSSQATHYPHTRLTISMDARTSDALSGARVPSGRRGVSSRPVRMPWPRRSARSLTAQLAIPSPW